MPKGGSRSVGSLKAPTRLPQGPKAFKERKDRGYVGGPGEPPPGFMGPTVSTYEWMIYWAIAKILGYPEDPRIGPFFGFTGLWAYQKAFDSGRHDPGGSVIDFVVYGGNGRNQDDIAMRVQTEFFHIYTDSDKHFYDLVQRDRLAEFFIVVDLYDQDFAWDPTGGAAIGIIRQALNGEYEPNPITDGTTQRVRRTYRGG